MDEPWVDPLELVAANQRCDDELRAAGMDHYTRVRSAWNEAAMIIRGDLTDRQIAKYEQAGFYSAEFKAARKAMMDKKSKKKGNFVERDGRLIYTP